MKKRKQKKQGSREQRDEARWFAQAFGYDKNAHTNIPLKEQFKMKWPRAKTGFAKDMFKAGYFGAVLHDASDWNKIHVWCKKTFKDYTWNGNLFWFKTKEDRELFMKQYKCTIFTGFEKKE